MLKIGVVHFVGLAFIALGIVLFYPGQVAQTQVQSQEVSRLPDLFPVTAIPVKAEALATASASPRPIETSLTAQAAVVVDVNSGAVLLHKNADTLLYPASTTKLMTALVAREVYDLDEVVMVTGADVAPGTVIGFKEGETLSVRELLAAALIQSGNDAATILANHAPGGHDAFVAAMNQKAQALHLSHSSFANATGIDDVKQQMTARDLGLLTRAVMQDGVLAQLVGTKVATITGETQTPRVLYNTNALLEKIPGVVGVKTGTTELAGEVLITQLSREDKEVLIVLMGSQNRYDETRRLIEWVFTQYRWLSPEEAVVLAT